LRPRSIARLGAKITTGYQCHTRSNPRCLRPADSADRRGVRRRDCARPTCGRSSPPSTDAAYSDGRHPDSVTFTTAEHDAQRRDFTINGLFYDPVASEVVDYIGGQDDLQRRMIRAIGDPRLRLREDKLRMLRAVRFAATFEFEIESATFRAIQEMAGEVTTVSAERIGMEIRRMLLDDRRVMALQLLRDTNLLLHVLPGSPRCQLWLGGSRLIARS
jgi:tRNA nucleotidyltransferase/poly(A) polymerase